MQDRFKFRVFDKEENKIIDFNDFKKGDIEFNFNPDTQEIWIEYDKSRYILIQSTGLKDKNGKLIYEGDIVNQIYEDETIYKCEVVYSNCSFQLKHIEDKNANYINTPMYCYAINYLGHYTEKKLEVIGNIYENPELIGGEQC